MYKSELLWYNNYSEWLKHKRTKKTKSLEEELK